MGKQQADNKTSFINSMCFKIMILVIASLVGAVVIVMVLTVTRFKDSMVEQISTQMQYMAETERDVVDVETGGVTEMVSRYAEILDSDKIVGYDTTNVMLITDEGVVKYSQNEAQAGQQTPTQDFMTVLEGGEDGLLTYTDTEGTKIAGYAKTKVGYLLVCEYIYI